MYQVYGLIDPRDNSLFYIGKGRPGRAQAHFTENEWWYNKRKGKRIERIQKDGYEPLVKIYFTFQSEATAYRVEEWFIKIYGRYGIDTDGILTNLTDSGRPPPRKNKPGTFLGRKHTDVTKEKIRKAHRKQFQDPNQRELRRLKAIAQWSDPEYRRQQTEKRKGQPATKPSSYDIHFPCGKIERVTNLYKWCEETGYPLGTLRDTLPQRKNKPVKYGKAAGMYIRKV